MNKWAIIYIFRLLAERLIGAVLFWMGAGRFDFRSGIFFAVYVLVAIVSGIIIYCKNPETLKERGFTIVSGGTDNHLMLVDVRPQNLTGKVAEHLLDDIGVTANKNAIPFDPTSPFVTSGIRLGTAALSTRGFGTEDMKEVGNIIADTLTNPDNEEIKDALRARVAALCAKYPLYA